LDVGVAGALSRKKACTRAVFGVHIVALAFCGARAACRFLVVCVAASFLGRFFSRWWAALDVFGTFTLANLDTASSAIEPLRVDTDSRIAHGALWPAWTLADRILPDCFGATSGAALHICRAQAFERENTGTVALVRIDINALAGDAFRAR
jgi:hypothetical protein